ncbi:DUF3823 domain-containing protein [Olivibacter sp. SDN3]|uniref:DUF3823 domain-containing protein n=1 Tax=Olivibacter sp. SDN3 TaxID=2764720 RepID=UPI00165111EE|nr:DUF3823 domain-containing protein [Olivibacter sp. SDN3]QNL47962.1 DUF3823 domain-containing protein [Olivibacter sp. SDN3]
MHKITYFLFAIICLSGCEVDNYDPPSAPLNGRLVFENQPIGIRQGINVLQLYQPGFENADPIRVNVMQDGSFSSMLFEGTYKMVNIAGSGPWENNPDSITINLSGETTVDIHVTPFFSLNDAEFSITDGILSASCHVKNNVSGRPLENVSLFIGKTTLVDHVYRLTPSSPESSKIASEINMEERVILSQDLQAFENEANLFARIGVKAVGHPEMIYSTVWKIR